MAQLGKRHALINADVTPGADTNLLAAVIQTQREDSICRIAIVTSGDTSLRAVPSSGSAFLVIPATGAATVTVVDIPLDPDRTWNFQILAGLTDVTYFSVQELSLVV